MSKPVLPKLYEPYRLADAEASFEGTVSLATFTRLSDLLESDDGDLTVDLSFFRNEEGYRVLTGHVKGTVLLRCQRCLNAMNYELDSDIHIVFAFHDEMARSLSGQYDACVLTPESRVSLAELIEDDLILSVPAFPSHPEDECDITDYSSAEADEPEPAPEQKAEANPFSILADLKKPE